MGSAIYRPFHVFSTLAFAAACSCSGTTKGPDPNGPIPQGMLEHSIRSGERLLGGHVVVEGIHRGRTGQGAMLYTLDLRNEGHDPVAFRVYPRWYDSLDQWTQGGVDRWHRYELKSGERQTLEMRAPTPEIVRAAIVVEPLTQTH